MSTTNRIDITIPAEVIASVQTKLQEIRTALQPYLFTLSADDRRSSAKLGDKTVAFVQKSLDYSGTNPQYAPVYFSKQELEHDFTVVQALQPINGLLQQLASDVDDTVTLAGSEAYVQSLVYYGAIKNAAHTGQPGAKPIYEDLSQRFPGSKRAAPVQKQ